MRESTPALDDLLERAQEETLRRFKKDWQAGLIKDDANTMHRRRRDYGSWQRRSEASPEAHELARHLLDSRRIDLAPAQFTTFALAVNAMLIRLYDEFLALIAQEGSR